MRNEKVERAWQAFLRQKGMTDDSPVDDPRGFYAEWENWLADWRDDGSGGSYGSGYNNSPFPRLPDADPVDRNKPMGSRWNPIQVDAKKGGL
ncbi:MAG: hypothetical protein U1A78_41625 [Polyangia bacterium]